MNNKKKMVLGAAFIVAIMALAGIGYAATHPAYEGTTSSVTDTYDVDYVVAKLNTEAYSNAADLYITYDTVTDYDGSNWDIQYTWSGSTILKHSVSIEVPATDDPEDTFTLTATVDTSDIDDDYELYYKIGTVAATYIDSKTTITSEWTKYTTAVNAGAIVVGTPVVINWIIVPADPADPGTAQTVTMPAVEYLVTAAQGVVTSSP